MNNISKDLRGLFKEYVINKNKPVIFTPSVNGHMEDMSYSNSVKIYFYEWSNVCSTPRTFYTVNSFDLYLKSCGIYAQLYEKDILVNLGESFVSCYRGKKQLCIRATYKHLLETMNEHDRMQTDVDKHKLEQFKESRGITAPTCNNEGEYDGHWYG